MLADLLMHCRAALSPQACGSVCVEEKSAHCHSHAVHPCRCHNVQQNQLVFGTPTEPAILQEDASLYEDEKLVHVYKGTFTSEYTATRQTHRWKLTRNSVTF